MDVVMRRRTILLVAGLFALVGFLATAVSADPDPPLVDGGNVTFDGDWLIDPGDHLTYVNQTIVLNGNLTVDPDGTLEMVNSTLYMNGTPSDWEWSSGIRVWDNGTLNVTLGSTVRPFPGAGTFYWIMEPGSHTLLEDSAFLEIGFTGPLSMSGIYSEADDTVVRNCMITMGNKGLILDGVDGAMVVDTVFQGPSRTALELMGGTTNVTVNNLTMTSYMEAVHVFDSHGVLLSNVTIVESTYGYVVDNGTLTILNPVVRDILTDVVWYRSLGGSVDWRVDAISVLENSTLDLNGSLEVLSGGVFRILNSTLAINNPVANGTNGIDVRSGGVMGVTLGSNVTASSGGLRYYWMIDDGGNLELDGSTVSKAGWNSSWPGLVLASTGNEVNNTNFVDCYVGLTVEGDGNIVTLSRFLDDVIGVSWSSSNSTLSDLSFINCTADGLVLDGVMNVTVSNCIFSLPGATNAIYGNGSRDVRFTEVSIDGPPLYGIRALDCSNLTIADTDIVSTGPSILLDGTISLNGVHLERVTAKGGTRAGDEAIGVYRATNVTFTNVTAQGDFISVHIRDVTGISLTYCYIMDATFHGLRINNTRDILIDECQINGSSDSVYLEGVDRLVIRSTVITHGSNGLEVLDSTDITLEGSTIFNTTLGIRFKDSSSNLTVLDSIIQDAGTGIYIIEVSSNISITNLTLRDIVVGVEMFDGENLSIDRLTLLNCTLGLRMWVVGGQNLLADSVFIGIDKVVESKFGTNLSVSDCSFYDCAVSFDSDDVSNLLWRTESTSEMDNSSATLLGWFIVEIGGQLNISDSSIVFLGADASDSGITAKMGSTLRVLDGCVINGSGVPYSITAEGRVQVFDTTIIGGGELPETAALAATGDVATVTNVTFVNCQLALMLTGLDPTIRDCVFIGNRQGVLLNETVRPRFLDSSFSASNTSWDIEGSFVDSLQIIGCDFDGGGIVPTALELKTTDMKVAILTLINLTVSNYESWGLQDLHAGRLTMTGCRFFNASIMAGTKAPHAVVINDLNIIRGKLRIGEGGLALTDSVFVNASVRVVNNHIGSLISDCTFNGEYVTGFAGLEVEKSSDVRLEDVVVTTVDVGLRVSGGSMIVVTSMSIDQASSSAVDVNGSIVRFEACDLHNLNGSGLRVWNAGSRIEFRNGTITASTNRTGYDVDASGGGDAWLLNTTFNRTSVLSSAAGRVEVLWFVTVEPTLPWGGVLWDPQFLTVMDAIGIEVVNTSAADNVMRLYEFSEEDGVRTWATPHMFNVSDPFMGVRYSGTHTINGTRHIILDLVDISPPVARAGPDQVVDEDLVVTLDGTKTSDNDPTFHLTGSFMWSFDEYGTEVLLTGDVARYVFSVPGKFWVNLTVTDFAGNVATDILIIQVRDTTAPIVRFEGNVTVDEDEWYIFDVSATTDNDPSFDFTTGTFLWEIDLVTTFLEREMATFGHAFAEPGNFSGTLSVWDKADNLARVEFWVMVRDITPPLIAGVSSSVVLVPTDGLLDASQCSDNVGVVSYSWSVTFINESDGPDHHWMLEGAMPNFLFDRLGTYNVYLVLEDAAGNSNATAIDVVYNDLPLISLPEWAVAMVGETLEVPINVSDIYHNITELVVSVADGPLDAQVEGSPEGIILAWTPGSEHAGAQVTIVVEVFDGIVSSQGSISVEVNPSQGTANTPPRILSDPPLTAKRATPYIYAVEAEDPDGDVLGYVLLVGPGGMTISQGGTLSWDPPFTRGTVLVDVHLIVTDGRDSTEQSWTIRWREPPNQPPHITFVLDAREALVREEFLVDLTVYIQEPGAFDVDSDDANHLLEWNVSFDASKVSLVSKEGLVFRFQTLDIHGTSTINFTATDPSGASDTAFLDLTIKPRRTSDEDGEVGWLLWLVLALLIAVGIAGGAVAMRRRGRVPSVLDEYYPEEGDDFGPPPEGTDEDRATLSSALDTEGPVEVSSFVEVDRTPESDVEMAAAAATSAAPSRSRVVSKGEDRMGRPFHVEGVAIMEANGTFMASTGTVEDILGPYEDAIEEVRRGLRGDGLAVLELHGRRVLLALRSGLGVLCIVRGKEDDAFRNGLRDDLATLFKDRSTDGALGVLEDILAAAGPGESADVVPDAWTARLDAELGYQGSIVMVDVRLRNDTDHILNNVRLRLYHDEDALSIQSMTPKLLVANRRMSLGNVPPRKEHKVVISMVPELCMSSTLRLLATYTDMEGRTVHVPSPTMPVDVECPHIEAGGDVDDDKLLALSESGLGFSGRKVFDHGMDVDAGALFSIAVKLVVEQGPIKVLELDDQSLMRAEAWFIGSGEGGTPQVLIRVSSHGADHMLEIFVTSDDGATATGLLTYLAGEFMDRTASQMPGRRVERVRDAATLEEISIWPSLLDYKVMGD
jgi:hypothetical protein